MTEPFPFLSGPPDHAASDASLSEAERQLRTVVSVVDAGIVLKGTRGEILDCNPAAAEILGVRRDPVTGAISADPRLGSIREDGSPFPLEEWPAMVALRTGRAVRNGVMGFTRPGEPVRWARLNAVPLVRPGAAPHGVVVSLADITEERRAHAQLRRADRLASLGTLAAGVAHEVNNPLAYVQGNIEYVDGLLRGLAADATVLEDLHGALREALEGVARVKHIVQGLRNFAAHAGEPERRPVDPRRQIEAAVALARNEVSARATLRVDLPPSLPPVLAGEFDVSQVLVNLLVNAAHAVPEGAPSANEVRVSAGLGADGRLAMEVRDTGAGISPEDLPRIFDPFFTTKPVGHGTGLGLSICHGIVASLGGVIEVDSTPGRGTAFRVLLPVTLDAPLEPEAPAGAAPPGPRARVLVLDDEPLVARSVARVLAQVHEVTTVTSPAEVLRRARGGESWDVLLCDLAMPEMNGMELEAALASERPDLVPKVLFLTGGAFTERAGAFLAERPHLEKPVDAVHLRAAVAELIGAAQRAAS